jgi:asparagine synthase (glutamine-hydrolysing)
LRFRVELGRDPDHAGGRLLVARHDGCTAVTLGDGALTVIGLGSGRIAPELLAAAGRGANSVSDAAKQGAPGAGLVIVDHDDDCCRVLMPRIGIASVYWQATADRLSIASTPAALPCVSTGSAQLDPRALYDYVYFHMLPAPGSAYHGVAKLCGGHCLTWQDGSARVERYWRPRFGDAPPASVASATAELRELLDASVRRALGDAADAGAFLSGGLDSSTVSGYAAQARPGIRTVSMGFDAAGYDEMQYARIASRHFRTTPLEYYVTPEDVLKTLPEIAASFPEPFGNSSAAAVYHCARIAREHGVTLLLAGDGGDELFGGNERYAKQLVFERYGAVPRVLRDLLLEPAVDAAAHLTRAFPIGKAHSYIEQAKIPLPDRLQHYNFLHRHAPADVFMSAVLDHIDTGAALRRLQQEYATPQADSPIDRMLFMDWKFTLHDNDLVKVNTMCSLAGVDVAYPMLDPALVDFSMRLPPRWKVRDGELRWFYRRAMRGFLPDEILSKTKHGFGLPFGVWMRTHEGLLGLARDSLESLAGRGYFRPEFLREALRLHREGHASFYGELVWILTVLELWLQRNVPSSQTRS